MEAKRLHGRFNSLNNLFVVDNYYELQICNIFVRCGQVNGRAQIKLQYSAEIIVKSSDVIQKSIARRFKYLEVYVACGYIYTVQDA